MTIKTKNVAHRGYSAKYPENTMLAFSKAVEAGCDGIELDVHLTKDGELVIIHDENIRRTTNGSGAVGSFTLAELREFDASAGFRGMYGFNPIPTFREYCEYVADLPIFTNIELKNSIVVYQGLEEKVIAMLEEYGILDQEHVMFSSFNHYSLLICKKRAPQIKCGMLSEEWIINSGAYAKQYGMECVHPRHDILTPYNLQEIRENGIEINTWTVNTQARMEALLDENVEGIITNCPDILRNVIDWRKEKQG